jgi:hypothetical protein
MPTEKQCVRCGMAVADKNQKKPFSERFRSLLNGLFVVFGIATLASILAPSYAPSLWKTFPGLVVIYLVKSSADHMSESTIKNSSGQKKT